MPPLPSILDQETTNTIESARRHHKDLSEFQIPRLRSCVGPLSLQQSLAAELREDIDVFAREIESLGLLVGDQKGERARRELGLITDELKEALQTLRHDSRAALLFSKRTIDAQSKSRREELLRSSAVTEKQNMNGKTSDDALMRANENVTEALHRTINLMQGELERSVLSTQMLEASTASLRSTSSTHDALTNIMSTSKQLITALEKADWMDRLLVISAFAFFILVVLFIVKQRILDRGLRMAFWWTRLLPNTGGKPSIQDVKLQSKAISTTISEVISDAASAITFSVTSATNTLTASSQSD
ncbi:Sec20-domain-containing protein, partial [Infundibulicybe gibba]